jgi:hypothetical protein
MADFNLDRIRFRWRGEWDVSTTYIKDDIVYYQGKAYTCLVGHTSDTVNFYSDRDGEDSTHVPEYKWELMFDGFVWKQNWQINTFYSEGDIVTFKGYVYQCIISHTSGSSSTAGLVQNLPNWIIVAKTYNWLNTWTVNAYYDLGDIVRYNGITYICKLKHRANSSATLGLEADLAKWDIVTRSDHWLADWQPVYKYNVDDIVKYGGTVYRCVTHHTSDTYTSPTYLGLENNQASWEPVVIGIEYKDDWLVSTRYKLQDIVKWNHTLWICTTQHKSGATNLRSDESNWTVWLPGTGFENVWFSNTEYKKGDIVLHGGYAYTALQNNFNSLPSVNGIVQNTGNWELLKEGYRHRGEWDSSTPYKTGDVIRNTGYLYVATADSTNVQPDLLTSWKKLVTGSHWKNTWDASGVNYNLGDVVTDTGITYNCVQRHISTTSLSRPSLDVTNAYWIVLNQGVTSNVLSTRGDLRTHNGTSTVRYPIGNPGEVLKSPAGIDWNNLGQINKVYYVSVDGLDISTNGKTLAAPFRTIKYAMDYIQADLASRAPATVFVKTGIYQEQLPISIPANVALVGDELRSTNVQPAAGYAAFNMFYVRNGSGIRNMTLQGLYGTLGEVNAYGTRRPSAGAFVSLDPGSGPSDSAVWITTKSPYIQNVTSFGTGCIGMKIDGALHNSGNKSIVANDFTQVISDGIGYWANNLGRSELVSVFTYYCYIGYLSTMGGILRATNGNNSYGLYGSRAEGYNVAEANITASINNRELPAQVSIVHTNGSAILAFGYSHAGQTYTSATDVIIGSGINVAASYDEFRSNAISQIRVVDPSDSTTPGGLNYQYLFNNAQIGDAYSITLSGADTTGTSVKYLGMRVFIDSGKGVGQYGYISGYDAISKVAVISRESDDGSGWDHVYPGYPIETLLDNTTRYKIEPRVIVNEPLFSLSLLAAPSADTWKFIAYGLGHFVAVDEARYAMYSTNDGNTWSSPLSLGAGYSLSGLVFTGTKFLVARELQGAATHSTILQSSNGETWATVTLPTAGRWSGIAANSSGNVVLIGYSSQTVLYSANNGDTWSSTTIPGTSQTWTIAAYGAGKFVTIDPASGAIAYSSNNGATWTVTASALSVLTWNSITYGNGRFVAITATGNMTAYSFDGITWYQNTITSGSTFSYVTYGDGVFLATGTGNRIAKSADGKIWRTNAEDSTAFSTIVSRSWRNCAYNKSGTWIAVADSSTSQAKIQTGARAFARATVASSRITGFIMYDPGSNYISTPTVTIVDSQNTVEVQMQPRVNSGVLGQPYFSNRGTGYVTATATISGDGYADIYQTGKNINLKNLSRLPGPGASLFINGITDVNYRVVTINSSSGTVPNITANITISPAISNQESPEHNTSLTMREEYSQVRLTGHDFLDVGTGNFTTSNYPDLYVSGSGPLNEAQQENEASEIDGGRVFYTSTDQDGNFRVGELFQVQQNSGIVSVNADYFDLNGLSELSLGGIIVGGSAVVIREFSKEPTFVANSNSIVPTQAAIIKYLESKISDGGANALTNALVAGRVGISGNTIRSTAGEQLRVLQKVNFTGGIDGSYTALQYFAAGSRVAASS